MSRVVSDINSLLLPRYLLNDIYPYPEGVQLEFKKCFHINQHDKYRETLCAFLNTNGGHMIFGILDNCVINGCALNDGEKDRILLFVDSIYNILKKTNGEPIHPNSLKVYFEEIAKNIYIIIITCYRDTTNDITYQFIGGDSWIRMNASNMKTKYGKLYTVQDVLNIKQKMYIKQSEIISKLKKEYRNCEDTTILEISNIFYKKEEKEKQIIVNEKFRPYFNGSIFITINILIVSGILINFYV